MTLLAGRPWEIRARRLAVLAVLFGLVALASGGVLSRSADGAAAASASQSGRKSPLSGLPVAARGVISAAVGRDAGAYRVKRFPGGSAQARNPAQGLTSTFSSSGVRVRSRGVEIGLSLRAVGYGSNLRPVDAVAPRLAGNRVTYAHNGLSEWYANGPLGLEQGFTLLRAPEGPRSGALTLSLGSSGTARASMEAGGREVVLAARDGTALHYGWLTATDARGRTLPSDLALADGRLTVHVDARGAKYPVRIDPLVQGRKLQGGEEAGGGMFGFSVALSADGNTALVGGPRDNNYAGAVWVFTRVNGAWSQQGPKLLASESGSGGEQCQETVGGEVEECSAGRSVALSSDGNVALVGSPRERGPCAAGECNSQGAAWVFTRSGSTWSMQTKLRGGAEESAEGRFGRSVALSLDGKTALVGAPSDRSAPGAAWVFTRTGSGWIQQGPKLTAADEQGEGHLGGSAALSGDGNTALLGGPGDNGYAGAAWVFTRSGSAWTQLGGKLTGEGEQGEGHFGFSVALSADGSTALVGARADNGKAGAAWAFSRSGGSFVPGGPKLTAGGEGGPEAEFGYGVALSSNGSIALIGAPHDEASNGAAWLFARSAEGWTKQGSKLTGEAHRSWFGASVTLGADGTTALIGAPVDEDRAGAVWVFVDPSARPAVTGLSPDAGPDAGGTAITITGNRLAQANAVRFGSVPAARFTVNGDGSITAISPPNPEEKTPEGREGKVRVTVTTPEGESPLGPVFTYLRPATVKGLSPAEGPTSGGTAVTITGSHIGDRTQSVTFGGVSARAFTVSSPESLTAISPPQPAGTVHVTVTTLGGTSKTGPPDRFTYVLPPASTSSPPTPSQSPGDPAAAVLGFTSGCSATLLSRSLPVVSSSRASVKLRWRGSGACRGKLRLNVKVRHGRSTRTKTIATATFALLPGKARTVSMKLSATGRRLYRSHHQRLSATLQIMSVALTRTQARTASVRLVAALRPAAARPKKRH